MAVLAKLAKTLSRASKAASKAASAPGHVTGHFATNSKTGVKSWVRDYTRKVSLTQKTGVDPIKRIDQKIQKVRGQQSVAQAEMSTHWKGLLKAHGVIEKSKTKTGKAYLAAVADKERFGAAHMAASDRRNAASATIDRLQKRRGEINYRVSMKAVRAGKSGMLPR